MENITSQGTASQSPLINRTIYSMMVIIGIVSLLQNDWMMAVVQIGLALVFDPFDTKQAWNLRPLWQRIWLIFHLAVVMGLLIVSFFVKK